MTKADVIKYLESQIRPMLNDASAKENSAIYAAIGLIASTLKD